jgi:hypothetical protein
MLTIEGMDIFSGNGLGVYQTPTDFVCGPVAGNYVCHPRTDYTRAVYESLQRTIKVIAAQMTAAGSIRVPRDMTTLDVDGAIGRITTLGVQVIATAFSAAVQPSPEVAATIERDISGEEAVKRVAMYANEINNWFVTVSASFPEAIKPKPEVVKEIQKEIVEKVIYRDIVTEFRPIGAIVIGAGLVTIMGLTAAAIVAARRKKR